MDSWSWFLLIMLFLAHWFIILYTVLYVFIVSRLDLSKGARLVNDVFYVVLVVGTFLHWMILKNECIISYLEKKTLDTNYVLGSDPLKNPSLFLGYDISMANIYMQLGVFIIWSLIVFNVGCIVTQYFDDSRRKVIAQAICVIYVLLIIYMLMMYKQLKETT